MKNRVASKTHLRAGAFVTGSWGFVTLASLAVLIPKCPLCIAAYLCLFGVSASAARDAATLGRPLCVCLIALSTLATLCFVYSRRGKRRLGNAAPSCCAHEQSLRPR